MLKHVTGVSAASAAQLIAHLRAPLYRNAYALILSDGLSSLLGLVYWALAARFYTTEQVGHNAAIISTMTFLAGLAFVNLKGAVIRFLPCAGSMTKPLVVYAYFVGALGALVAGLVFLFGYLWWAPSQHFLVGNSLFTAWFLVALILWAIFGLQDQVLTSLRQTDWVPMENVTFGIAKLLLLAPFADWLPQLGIFASWTLPVPFLLLVVNFLLFHRLIPQHVERTVQQTTSVEPGQIVRFVAGDLLGTLFWMTAMMSLPLIVVNQVGVAANAYFYLAWTLAYPLHLVAANLASSLTVEGAMDEAKLEGYARRTLIQSIRLLAPVALVVQLAAPAILWLFGANYAEESANLLRLLALAALPYASNVLFLSMARVRRQLNQVIFVQGITCGLVLSLSIYLLQRYGLLGIGLAWLISHSLVAVVILIMKQIQTVRAHVSALRTVEPTATWPRWRLRVNPPTQGAITVTAWVFLIVVLLLWLASLQNVALRQMNDYGLVSVLSAPFFVALMLVTISYGLLVHRVQSPTWLLLLHLVVLLLILHATPAILYEEPRYAWAYKHIGVAEYIQRLGAIDPAIDIYFNWPAFFALSALIADLTGFDSVLSFAAWAPPFFNLLFLGGALLIFKALTTDRRLIWLGLWFFAITNWVGQDYFAPQALTYFFYLLILGICLTWFPITLLPTRTTIQRWLVWPPLASLFHTSIGFGVQDDAPPSSSSPRQRALLMGTLLLLFAAVVAAHQLTPFMIIGSVTALVIFQRCRVRVLPLLFSVLTISWIFFIATVYMQSHFRILFNTIGNINSNALGDLTDLSQQTPGRVFVAMSSRVLTLGVWGLALLGGVRRLRQGYWDLAAGLLASAPFAMFVVQSYGGEMIFRVYLFSLPFMVFGTAALFYPNPQAGRSWHTGLLTILVSSVLLAGFCSAYYGNERGNYFTHNELQATRFLYQSAPRGSLILTMTYNIPRKFEAYEQFIYNPVADTWSFERKTGVKLDLAFVERIMTSQSFPAAYLILSRSQREHVSLYNLLPTGALEQLEKELFRSPRFQVVFANDDATIFQLQQHGDHQ
jgi:O-antigen/teichoic acid export membrane protein